MAILGLFLAEAMLANVVFFASQRWDSVSVDQKFPAQGVETTSKRFPAQGVGPAKSYYDGLHCAGEPVMLGNSYWLCSCSLVQHCSL